MNTQDQDEEREDTEGEENNNDAAVPQGLSEKIEGIEDPSDPATEGVGD